MDLFPVQFFFGDSPDSILNQTIPARDAEALANELERKLEQGFFRIETPNGFVGVNGAKVRFYIIFPPTVR